ncbi:AbrB/MazE/SpoVT family DNA-binding domain-containing protein [Cetobacterium sp. 2A]|nr:AbrB/MazE/SpoVT family DNA-binding domain-containing protein [Cetobacterium sp. 2A]MBC2856960.1 AbrB/MazE/SpoVT family DNA-binding domain-containing protein [Cetobacterium sp. 2A]
MDERKAKILWSKSGGSDTIRVTLPVSWIRKMGLSKEEMELDIFLMKK